MNYKVFFNFTEFPDRFFEKTLISETSGQKRQNERYIIFVKTLTLLGMSFLGLLLQVGKGNFRELHAAKSVRIRSFFWFVFSRIWTESVDLQNKSLHSVQTRKKIDQKKLRICTISQQWGTSHPLILKSLSQRLQTTNVSDIALKCFAFNTQSPLL